jgi:MFS transporter, ACS family, DAL5 transporter family protein
MSDSKNNEKVTNQEPVSDEGSSNLTVDPQLEKRLVRKSDLYIIPEYMIIYIFSFLDRSNIGNAKVSGMAKDLKLQGSEFNGERIYIMFIQET